MGNNILVILGLAVFCGMIGALVFQKLKFPQVVGNIIIGLLLGESVFGLISQQDIANLQTFNMFALGIIGFLVGGELKIETFKKYAKQFTPFSVLRECSAFSWWELPRVCWFTRFAVRLFRRWRWDWCSVLFPLRQTPPPRLM